MAAPPFKASGCLVFPIADDSAGGLFRFNGLPVGIAYTQPITGHFGGACTYDSNLGQHGILQSDGTPATNPVNARFGILATQNVLQN